MMTDMKNKQYDDIGNINRHDLDSDIYLLQELIDELINMKMHGDKKDKDKEN